MNLSQSTLKIEFENHHFGPSNSKSWRNPNSITTSRQILRSSDAEIVQSSNGIMLCRYTWKLPDLNQTISFFPYDLEKYFHRYYIYNPTTQEVVSFECLKSVRGITLAFDPTKFPHYRVVCVHYKYPVCWLEIYSSETHTWTASAKSFPGHEFWFKSGVYWNDALHWVDDTVGFWYLKLDDESLHKTEVPPIPDGLFVHDRRFNHLVESRDCLLYVDTFNPCPWKFNIYEMKRDYSGWSVKYEVDLSELREWEPRFCDLFLIYSLVLGQGEEDSFLVFQIPLLAIRYNLVLKTSQKLCDLSLGVFHCFNREQFTRYITAPMLGFPFIESLFLVSDGTL